MSLKSSQFHLQEEDVIRLILEFLSNRDLNITQLSCERETGVFNGLFSDDLLFLRQLILDGQWDDVLQFVQPLESIETFDKKQFKYLVNKHKYIELLCIRSEAGPLQSVEVAVNEVVQCLNHLEQFCPNKEDYNELCLLLTLPNLCDHKDFKHWNPSKWRINCFKAILPLIEKYLPPDKKSNDSMQKMAKSDRLMQLIIKGILYESCVEYCQQKATNSSANKSVTEMKYSNLLDGTGFSNSDLSLLSWLQSIPPETFSFPFEQKTLNVEVEQLEKPSLMASWSEVILVTPIKPKIFPHSATPFTRMRASDLMSKSLTPGLVDGLTRSLMTFSVCDMAAMSRSSFAATGFHLNSNNTGNSGNKKDLQTSVDRLFEEGEVFSSTCFGTLPTIPEKPSPVSTTLVDEHKSVSHNESKAQMQLTPKSAKDLNQSQNTPDLWQKFQKEKQKLMEKLMNEEMLINSSRLQSNAKRSAQSLCDSYLQTPPIVSMANVSSNEKVTPPTQTGFSNFPNPEKLTTSTPKGNHLRFREGINLSPNESPIFPTTQNGLSQQRNLSFNRSANEVLTTNSSLSSHQSSQQLSYASQLPKANTHTMHGPNTSMRSNVSTSSDLNGRKPQFVAVTRLEDAQAIRAAEFHPNGQLYAIGSNSKTLRICGYPKHHELRTLREDHVPHQPTVLSKRLKHHKGSIYCLAWNTTGDLLATGSNDKTIKMMRFNCDNCELEGGEAELTMHDGTIRDMCFMEDLTNRSSLLISGGAGDCKIYVTDCDTATPFQALSGHSGHILSLYTWGGAMFVSGSQDRTIRFWDLRTSGCVNLITAPPASGSGPGSPVAAVCVDPSGKLLVSGHEDSNCMLYDIRGGRIIQTFQPHMSDIRTIRFSNKAYYLLTGGYDNKVVLTDLQGDLTQPLPSVVVAEHSDKVIQGRWHPNDFTFLTTSADKTATLWALPN